MNESALYESKENQIGEKSYHLSDFFDHHWESYIQSPAEYIQEEQYKAVSAIRSCRKEALGVDHYLCKECGEISYGYHSCRHRFCPRCSWRDTLEWADRMKADMLDIAHRHVIFTLPHQLNALIKDNKGLLLNILFQSASESIKDWMYHKYGLIPGIISVLHTAGETKEWHTHVHMIVSWGGLDSSTQLRSIKGEYINYDFIQAKFRCKFEDKLIALYDGGSLYQKYAHRQIFMRFIKRINEKHWRIQFEPVMQTPSEVIIYIGRYSKRACMSEYKITRIEGSYISFRYKDYKTKDYQGKALVKELTLHYRDFFPRLLQHVPLPYFRLVRYYGAYAARTKSILRKLGMISQKEKQEEQPDDRSTNEPYEYPESPKICKHCNIEKTYLYTVFKSKDGRRIFMSRMSGKKAQDKLKQEAA